jgi:hypothetical protein
MIGFGRRSDAKAYRRDAEQHAAHDFQQAAIAAGMKEAHEFA